MSRPLSLSLVVLTFTACHGGVERPDPCAGDPDCATLCSAKVDAPVLEGATHVPVGTTVTYAANPPASGNHWPEWENWEVFTTAVPREKWIHNLEHGGIVLTYNCDDCDDEIARLTALRSQRPPDRYNKQRVIVTPDADSPVRFAALAWGWRWLSDELSEDEINCFIDARYDKAPESIP